MRIKVSKNKVDELKKVENTLLLSYNGRLFTVTDLKFEESTRKTIFLRKTVTETFLVNCNIVVYVEGIDELRFLKQPGIEGLIQYNLLDQREKWVNLKNQLDKFGFEISKKINN